MKSSTHTNDLIHEKSPYLRQHAHNPVNWKVWNEKTLTLAHSENKLLLISIGYSTCHWCHVMEKECFEDKQVAEIMNAHYVSIKIDREERPDLDQVYMNALMLISGQGGWPLNIVALPDGRPLWGGTYFPKAQWMEALLQIQSVFEKQPEKALEYAQLLAEGVSKINPVIQQQSDTERENFDWNPIIETLSKNHDTVYGGEKKAPKFMLPVYWKFLMRYAYQNHDSKLSDQVFLTLEKMAFGGIFDHINGGFSRYSVDDKWHVPHFEKMLYDNAQLVSLYSQAFSLTGKKIFKETVYETLSFVENELTDPKGGFYSALDADSINNYGILEEGSYYVFTKEELQTALQNNFQIFEDYYNINEFGHWENGKYVLIRTLSDKAFCSKHHMDSEDFFSMKKNWKKTLTEIRKYKERPRLDNKIITSWNALMSIGYMDAYRAFGEKRFLDTALKNVRFICENMLDQKGKLARIYNPEGNRNYGFLDDYAFFISGLIKLYETTLDNQWIELSKKLTQTVMDNFFDKESGLFFYTSKQAEKLFAVTFETSDNVIPSSNAVMAQNLFWLGKFFENNEFNQIARQMLQRIPLKKYPAHYTAWLDLQMNFTHPFYEIVVMGKKALKKNQKISSFYIPNCLLAGSTKPEDFPLLQARFFDGKTYVYLCEDNLCHEPQKKVREIVKRVK